MLVKHCKIGTAFTYILFIISAFEVNASPPFEIVGPVGSGSFGASVEVLPNSNIVVADPGFSNGVGAVYLYNKTGQLISTLTGTFSGDMVGSGGITVLANGNFVISSPKVDLTVPSGFAIDCGAVTLGFSETGVSGTVSAANSTTGNASQDRIGEITTIQDGNFIIGSPFWNSNRGAVTWRSGTTLMTGPVTAANSVVGTFLDDYLAKVVILPNGNYVVYSDVWSDGGAVFLCTVHTGCSGPLSESNALIGMPGDRLGVDGVTVLRNSNFVIASGSSNGSRGKVVLASGSTPTVGFATPAISLIGSATNSFVGSGGVFALENGNYVVLSPNWKDSSGAVVGAATFGNGETGISGTVSSGNSLIGGSSLDFQRSTIVPLTNGNYVISLPSATISNSLGAAVWGDGQSGITGTLSTSNSLYKGPRSVVALTNGNYAVRSASFGAAVTWGNGATGITGPVSASNSLIGIGTSGIIGGGLEGTVTALTNGNFVFAYPSWDNGDIPDVGAATLCAGDRPTVGDLSTSNSLYGASANDMVGFGGVIALSNGNYVVRSYLSNYNGNSAAGAVTFGDGTTGVVGPVSVLNSLTGTSAQDRVGESGVTGLSNGNYVVTSFSWANRGAVTFGNGIVGTSGPVSHENSVVGNVAGDRVGTLGNNNSVVGHTDGAFTFLSANWDNGSISDAGAVTIGNGRKPTIGPIGPGNSALGTVSGAGPQLIYDYNAQAHILAVGRPHSNRVSVLFNELPNQAQFDFDGDGKSDISILRPSDGQWWLDRSTDGLIVHTFGNSSDTITPGDFTGDGKTDVAIWRPSDGEWFVLRSENFTYYSFPFGTVGDTPVARDYDGDGITDAAVYRDSNATWYVQRSTGGTSSSVFGAATDRPVPADYDGDGQADFAIFRPSNGQWWLNRSSAGVIAVTFGNASDRNVAGDYTGDGKADVAIFRESTGEWFVLRSEDFSFYSFPFGTTNDKPVPADFDGDGRFDAAVFRPSTATWYLNRTTAGLMIRSFGATTDIPIPNTNVR